MDSQRRAFSRIHVGMHSAPCSRGSLPPSEIRNFPQKNLYKIKIRTNFSPNSDRLVKRSDTMHRYSLLKQKLIDIIYIFLFLLPKGEPFQ